MWKKLCELLVKGNCRREVLLLDIFPGDISFNIPKKQKS